MTFTAVMLLLILSAQYSAIALEILFYLFIAFGVIYYYGAFTLITPLARIDYETWLDDTLSPSLLIFTNMCIFWVGSISLFLLHPLGGSVFWFLVPWLLILTCNVFLVIAVRLGWLEISFED